MRSSGGVSFPAKLEEHYDSIDAFLIYANIMHTCANLYC